MTLFQQNIPFSGLVLEYEELQPAYCNMLSGCSLFSQGHIFPYLCWTKIQRPLFRWFLLLLITLHLSFRSPMLFVLFLENNNNKAYSLCNMLWDLNMKRRQQRTVEQWLLLKKLDLVGVLGSFPISKQNMLKQGSFLWLLTSSHYSSSSCLPFRFILSGHSAG